MGSFQIACYIVNHTPALKSVLVAYILFSFTTPHWLKQIHPSNYIFPDIRSDFSLLPQSKFAFRLNAELDPQSYNSR